MGFTTNSVVLSSEGAVVSVDDEELPQAEIVRASVAAMARGRNVIEIAYESPDTPISTNQRDTQSVQ
jgi:hypothetical protein